MLQEKVLFRFGQFYRPINLPWTHLGPLKITMGSSIRYSTQVLKIDVALYYWTFYYQKEYSKIKTLFCIFKRISKIKTLCITHVNFVSFDCLQFHCHNFRINVWAHSIFSFCLMFQYYEILLQVHTFLLNLESYRFN